MGFHTIAGAAFRALTARKDGPSLYDVCDPVLLKYRGGDPHLGKFYRTALGRAAEASEIGRVIRRCGAHLLGSFAKNGFIPTYAAFNLLGDPDMGGREMLMALTGLNSRGYKNSTLSSVRSAPSAFRARPC